MSRPGGLAAVLLDGSAADSRSWWRVGPVLALGGYRAIGVDLPERWFGPHR